MATPLQLIREIDEVNKHFEELDDLLCHNSLEDWQEEREEVLNGMKFARKKLEEMDRTMREVTVDKTIRGGKIAPLLDLGAQFIGAAKEYLDRLFEQLSQGYHIDNTDVVPIGPAYELLPEEDRAPEPIEIRPFVETLKQKVEALNVTYGKFREVIEKGFHITRMGRGQAT